MNQKYTKNWYLMGKPCTIQLGQYISYGVTSNIAFKWLENFYILRAGNLNRMVPILNGWRIIIGFKFSTHTVICFFASSVAKLCRSNATTQRFFQQQHSQVRPNPTKHCPCFYRLPFLFHTYNYCRRISNPHHDRDIHAFYDHYRDYMYSCRCKTSFI